MKRLHSRSEADTAVIEYIRRHGGLLTSAELSERFGDPVLNRLTRLYRAGALARVEMVQSHAKRPMVMYSTDAALLPVSA